MILKTHKLLSRICSPHALIGTLLFHAVLLVSLSAAAADSDSRTGGFAHFVTRQQDRLMEGGSEFRFVSVNMPDSLQIISNYQFDGDYRSTRTRLPDEFELRDCVRTVAQMGGRVMRTFVISCRTEASPTHMFNVACNPVVGNEAALRVLDRLLQICNEEGVRVIIPLIAYNSAIRGDPSTYGADFWKVGSAGNLKFKNMVTQLVGRTNSYTGVPYREDRAILGWHTGNELVIGTDPDRRAWLHDFAAFLKQLDPQHLVIDGRNKPQDIDGHYDEFLSDPNIDALSYHTYVNLPRADTPQGTLRLLRNLTREKMPLILTEVAMYTSPKALRALLDEVIADGTVGANWWGLRFHNRDGGFYKHSDQNSEFEDLNWPGFSKGPGLPAAIDRERELLGILADYSWKIRGMPAPAAAVPSAPHLLPIRDTGHISWQGSTGAGTYTLQRSEAADGPWSDIASNLSDHLIAYAAQYCDSEVIAGRSYFYRVIAHNAAGSSPASNIVGPVAVNRHWLLDELFDLRTAAPESHNLRIDQAYAHTSYLEDVALAVRADPARSAELVYRLPRALREFTATVFDAQIVPKLYVLGSGNTRREVQPEIASYDGGKRRRLSLRLEGDETGLVIELSAQAAATQAIGRVEIATKATP